jgi:hypothetical protein
MKGKLADAMLQATPFQAMMGHVVLALEALEQAKVAQARIDTGDDTPHLRGKVLNLKFFVNNLLPQAIATGKAIQNGDTSCLDAGLFA